VIKNSSGISYLENNLNLLISLFPRMGNWLSWSQVLFLENTSFTYDRVYKIPRFALIPFKDYEKRFNELLDSGYHWINMNAFGIWNDNLIVVIELPNYTDNIPRDKVSVNFSGPAIINEKPQWDLSKRIEIVE
jgi:hypothetical protein